MGGGDRTDASTSFLPIFLFQDISPARTRRQSRESGAAPVRGSGHRREGSKHVPREQVPRHSRHYWARRDQEVPTETRPSLAFNRGSMGMLKYLVRERVTSVGNTAPLHGLTRHKFMWTIDTAPEP